MDYRAHIPLYQVYISTHTWMCTSKASWNINKIIIQDNEGSDAKNKYVRFEKLIEDYPLLYVYSD